MSYSKIIGSITVLFFASLLLYACNQQSVLKEDFNCKEIFFNNLEVIKDIKGTFSVEFPTSWKTSVYTDEVQSSIYAADTTKQLTEAILLDVNYIYNSITISDIFKLKIEHENLSNKLIQKTAKEFSFLDKPSYYVVSIGKKGKYKYKSLQIFVHINKEKSLVVKAEIYGDSLVNQRLCKAITLIEKIKLEQ